MTSENLTENFFKDPELCFDIEALQKEALSFKANYPTQDAICLTQIPNDPDSTKNENLVGAYWTVPRSDGVEEQRFGNIDENSYTELVPTFKNSYLEEVIQTVASKWQLGRIRLLWKKPRTCLSWHRDPEKRLHIPILTNYGARMIIDDECKHMPADGSVWITDNTKYHNVFNGGEEDRIHLVATVLGKH